MVVPDHFATRRTILVDISSHPKTPDLLGEPKREEGKKKGQPNLCTIINAKVQKQKGGIIRSVSCPLSSIFLLLRRYKIEIAVSNHRFRGCMCFCRHSAVLSLRPGFRRHLGVLSWVLFKEIIEKTRYLSFSAPGYSLLHSFIFT